VVCEKARGAQVYDLDTALAVALDQDVLGLKVGMNEA
jgi:hypothetical protein